MNTGTLNIIIRRIVMSEKNRLKEFISNVSLIDFLIKIISSIIAFVGSIGTTSFSVNWFINKYPKYSEYETYFIICIVLILLLIFLFIYKGVLAYIDRKYIPKFSRVDSDFIIKEMKLTCDIKANNRMCFKKLRVLKARNNNSTSYSDRYRWTGTGEIDIRSGVKGHTLTHEDPRGVFQCYTINFHRAVKKNEIITSEIIMDLLDSEKTAKPFIGVTIEEPTESLELYVKFPEDITIQHREVVLNMSLYLGAKTPIETKTKTFNEHNICCWKIDSPKLFHHYELRWITN